MDHFIDRERVKALMTITKAYVFSALPTSTTRHAHVLWTLVTERYPCHTCRRHWPSSIWKMPGHSLQIIRWRHLPTLTTPMLRRFSTANLPSLLSSEYLRRSTVRSPSRVQYDMSLFFIFRHSDCYFLRDEGRVSTFTRYLFYLFVGDVMVDHELCHSFHCIFGLASLAGFFCGLWRLLIGRR